MMCGFPLTPHRPPSPTQHKHTIHIHARDSRFLKWEQEQEEQRRRSYTTLGVEAVKQSKEQAGFGASNKLVGASSAAATDPWSQLYIQQQADAAAAASANDIPSPPASLQSSPTWLNRNNSTRRGNSGPKSEGGGGGNVNDGKKVSSVHVSRRGSVTVTTTPVESSGNSSSSSNNRSNNTNTNTVRFSDSNSSGSTWDYNNAPTVHIDTLPPSPTGRQPVQHSPPARPTGQWLKGDYPQPDESNVLHVSAPGGGLGNSRISAPYTSMMVKSSSARRAMSPTAGGTGGVANGFSGVDGSGGKGAGGGSGGGGGRVTNPTHHVEHTPSPKPPSGAGRPLAGVLHRDTGRTTSSDMYKAWDLPATSPNGRKGAGHALTSTTTSSMAMLAATSPIVAPGGSTDRGVGGNGGKGGARPGVKPAISYPWAKTNGDNRDNRQF
jgi:hypothetical protein